MSSSQDVLREFLVNISYNVDENKRRKFNEGMTESVVKANLLTDALEFMAKRGVEAVTKLTTGMEQLHYQSQRTGASVQGIRALGYAASQLGSSYDDASQSLENFARKRKESPGVDVMLRSFGVDTRQSAEKVLQDTAKYISKLPYYLRLQREAQVGISDSLVTAITSPDAQKFIDEHNRRIKALGIDEQKAAADSAKLMQSFRSMGDAIQGVALRVQSKLADGLAPKLEQFIKYLDEHGDEIANIIVRVLDAVAVLIMKTIEFLPKLDKFVQSAGGWEKVLLGVAAALLLIFTRLSLIGFIKPAGWLLSLLGLGGAIGGAAAGALNYASKGEIGVNEAQAGAIRGIMGQRGGGAGGEPSVGATRPQQNANSAAVMDELKKGGYKENAVAAILGSMQTESGFKPGITNGSGHHGLWQWDGAVRWPKIKKWILDKGGDPNDARWQTRAWIAEHNAKPGDPLYDTRQTQQAGAILRGNPTIQEAVHGTYLSERFGAGEEGGRAANARGWLPHVQGSGVTATPGTPPPGSEVNKGAAAAPGGVAPAVGAAATRAAKPAGAKPAPAGGPSPYGTLVPFKSQMGLTYKPAASNTTIAPSSATTVNVYGDNPQAIANEVQRKQSTVHADLIRNTRGAVG